jgi:hypothetical protein
MDVLSSSFLESDNVLSSSFLSMIMYKVVVLE